MNAHVKALLTLSVLSVLLILGVTWGYSAMMSPFPEKAKTQVCGTTTLQAGDRVAAPDVTVSVTNAQERIIRLSPVRRYVAVGTGLVTVTHSFTTSVTAAVFTY